MSNFKTQLSRALSPSQLFIKPLILVSPPQWYTPLISALESQRQVDLSEFRVNLFYIVGRTSQSRLHRPKEKLREKRGE